MSSPLKRVALVTGASTGIGRAIASRLHREGCLVYGTGRSEGPALHADGFRYLAMDLKDPEAIRRGVQRILEESGRIDILVNNAGLGLNGAVEELGGPEMDTLLATNVTGLVRMIQAVLPGMREQGSGLILNISSIAAHMGLPFRGMYCASKAAVNRLSESLRMEVAPYGIRVCIVEPGDFQTNINQNRMTSPGDSRSPYADAFRRINEQVIREVAQADDPGLVADQVWRIVNTRQPRLRYPVARPLARLSVVLKHVLPPAWFERLLRSHYQV